MGFIYTPDTDNGSGDEQTATDLVDKCILALAPREGGAENS